MTNRADEQYLRIMRDLLDRGVYREGRNGGTYGLFGEQMRFDLSEGFPLLTTKKVHFKSILVELLWFLRGDTNVKYLREHGVSIWDEWADQDGELGPVYGSQWRQWRGDWESHPYLLDGEIIVDGHYAAIDQISNLLDGLRSDPYGRRHIISAWNPAMIQDMALPPCHCLVQFGCRPGKHRSGNDEFDVIYLDCHLYQRSADWFLGVPFNIASYALLTHLVARELSMVPGHFIHSFGDLHLYANHRDQAVEQLTRAPRHLPELAIGRHVGIFDYEPGDIAVVGYEPHPAIKAEVSA